MYRATIPRCLIKSCTVLLSLLQIYRLYSNNQEYEMFRVNDALTTVPNETRMVVRLGRALQSGEVRVRLSLLRMGEVEVRTSHMLILPYYILPYFILPFCHSPVLQATDGLHHH